MIQLCWSTALAGKGSSNLGLPPSPPPRSHASPQPASHPFPPRVRRRTSPPPAAVSSPPTSCHHRPPPAPPHLQLYRPPPPKLKYRPRNGSVLDTSIEEWSYSKRRNSIGWDKRLCRCGQGKEGRKRWRG
ncbi:hypothetical protein VPH35_081617 [Triticum aestivum]|uniref:Uncharacterized protein n=1 Tax=Triticum urartu TaxID=4572 RepID=A0A8R7QC15_TRIUA